MFQQGNLIKRELSQVDEPMHDGGRMAWKQKEVPFLEKNPDGEQQKGAQEVRTISDPHTAALSAWGWVG